MRSNFLLYTNVFGILLLALPKACDSARPPKRIDLNRTPSPENSQENSPGISHHRHSDEPSTNRNPLDNSLSESLSNRQTPSASVQARVKSQRKSVQTKGNETEMEKKLTIKKEKHRLRSKRYRERIKQRKQEGKMTEQDVRYYQGIKNRWHSYDLQHPQVGYLSRKDWIRRNPERVAASRKSWLERHPDKPLEYRERYREKKLKLQSAQHSEEDKDSAT